MMKYWQIKAAAYSFLVVTVFFNASCKKEENDLGLAIQPQGDELNLQVSDTATLITYVEKGDSIRTDELSGDNLLGSYVDPFFGEIQSAIFAQPRISAAVNFIPSSGNLNDLVVDSVMLYLKISNFYGNTQPQTFEVYQLSEIMDQDVDYYSSTTLDSAIGNLVANGAGTIKPEPLSIGTVEGELVDDAIIGIPLDVNSVGWKIINQSGTGVLDGNDATGQFTDWFKGLLIKTNTPQQSVNEGGIIYADLLDEYSKITIFYRDTVAKDTIAYDLNFNSQSARYHRVLINNAGFYVGDVLADSTLGQNQFFAHTMGGVNGKVYFPYLEEFIKNDQVVVNKAELILPTQYYALDNYLPSNQLFLTRQNESGDDVFIEDFTEDLGGSFDFDENRYVFNVTRHLNKVLAGEIKNTPLTILNSQSGITANRVVFNGQETTLKDKPVLKLTFTNY